MKALDNEISALEAVEPWTELRAARTSLDAALKREEKVGELLSKAAELRSRASTEWPTVESKLLPTSAAVRFAVTMLFGGTNAKRRVSSAPDALIATPASSA